MYKQSQFTVVEPLDEFGLEGKVFVYSTRTSKSAVLPAEGWRHLRAKANEAIEPVPEQIARLVKLGLLVAIDEDERESLLHRFDVLRWNPQAIYPILAVTTGCNIGCTYCYEEGVQARTMTAEVADTTARWLIRRMTEDGVRELHPTLFGGEPLLYPELLFRLMDTVNEAADDLGVQVSYSCSSNGLFLTPSLARELAQRRMTQIQISLDGIKPVHDERRIGKRGQSTYEGSLAGLEVAAGIVANATLKVNFDRHNLDAIAPLFDDLAQRGLAGVVDVKLEAVAHQFPDSKVAHKKEHVIPPESGEMAEAYTRLQIEAQKRGFKVSRDTAHTTPCMLTAHHGVIIGPDGSIYKCISLVGRAEAAVGSIFDEDYDRDSYRRQMDVRKKTAACFEEKCPYVPVCMGGCGYEASVRGGKVDDRFCTYPYMKRYHFQQNLIRHEGALKAMGMEDIRLRFAQV